MFFFSNLPVDTVDTSGSISTRITVTFVDVDLTILTRCARSTDAQVTVDTILASTAKLTRIALAFIDLRLAQITGEAGGAVAGEAILAVDADTAATWIRGAVVDVGLTGIASEAGRTFARVPRDTILTSTAVLAR